MGQSILSGMWFPLEGLPEGMLILMKALPFKNATMLIQNVVNGYNDAFNDLVLPLIILVIYTIIILALATLMFRNKMKAK